MTSKSLSMDWIMAELVEIDEESHGIRQNFAPENALYKPEPVETQSLPDEELCDPAAT
jgi:hypothetical protein